MKMYLAGLTFLPQVTLSIHGGGFDSELVSRVNMLESFYYIQPWQTAIIRRLKSFMLDSGAYTFAYNPKNTGVTVDWEEYLDSYASYIVENDVRLFFELDIDPIVGYPKVEQMRARLEAKTGRRCIPVWHLERGLDDWYATCEEYDYVAIGGIADKGRTSIERYLPALIREAHRRGAKVHGLGYTNLGKLPHIAFDSVDSTAWLYGNRGGFLYSWDGRTMHKRESASNQRLKARDAARHNFIEWVRMGEDMEGSGMRKPATTKLSEVS